jgi:YbbR domain-containing protein
MIFFKSVKEKLSKAFSSRIFYIIFSLLASFAIWLYVAYAENPDVSTGISGVRVELRNTDYLTDRGLVVTYVSADTLSLRFLGKRNVVSILSSDNITASVDLAEIKRAGTYTLPYRMQYPINVAESSVSVTARSADTIIVVVDNLVKKDIPVRGKYDGGVAEGYRAEPIEISPSVITVSGPQEIISRIDHAWVNVLRENISKTVDETVSVVLMDEDGEEVRSENVTLSQSTVEVIIPVVMVKDVPLSVNLTPGAGADERNTVLSISPSYITLSGDAETLNALNQIVLGTIDLKSFALSTSQNFSIAIPNNTQNLTGTVEATVTISVEGLETRRVQTTNIQTTNETEGYNYAIITQSLEVLLRGVANDLEEVEPVNVRVVADLSALGATVGTYTVPAKIYVDGTENVGAIGSYTVTVIATSP